MVSTVCRGVSSRDTFGSFPPYQDLIKANKNSSLVEQ